MFASMRWLLIPALLAGWLVPAQPAASRAAAPSPAGVRDEAGMFPEDAKKKADQKIQQIREDYGTGLLIETVPKIPDADKAKYEELGKEKFFLRWTEFRAKKSGVRGIYVLICKEPPRIQVVADESLREKGFTTSVREDIAQKLAAGLKKGGKPGEGLLATVDYADAKLKTMVGKRSASAGGGGGRQAASGEQKQGFFSGLWGWVCIGLVVVLALWLVFGLIRAFTGASRPAGYGGGPGGPGGPGGGYGGGGYGGGGGGGGGGGFFTSLLGGMFGGAAGAWMYDSFFRGGSHGGGLSQAQAGAPPTASPTPGGSGDADYSGNTGGGADFGDNDGGGGGGGGGGADFGDDGGGGGGADFGDDGGGGGADFGDGGGGADFGGDGGGGSDF